MRAIATGGGGGIGAQDVDEETYAGVVASSVAKTTYKRVELSAAMIESWATVHGSAARELLDELNIKMQALFDLGVDQIPFNVHTRSKLGNLVAENPSRSPTGDAANAALIAWSVLITAQQKEDRADRKAKSARKLNLASAKAAPLTIDAQQAAVNELKRRKASEGKGGKRKRAQQDEGEEGDAEDLLAAAREAGCHHMDDDDEDYLVADSEQGPAFVLS